MRKISAHIIVLLAALPAAGVFPCSCDGLSAEESVVRTDVGERDEDDPSVRKPFRIAVESCLDGPSGRYALDVTLTQGADAEYTVSYSLDGRDGTDELELEGKTFASGSRALLRRDGAARFVLPDSEGRERSVRLTVRRGGTSREETVSWGRAPLASLSRVITQSGYGYPELFVTGSEGAGVCTLVFCIDGRTGAGVMVHETGTWPPAVADALEYDFSAKSTQLFLLPNLERGSHEVRVEVTRGDVTDRLVSDWTVE